MVCHGAYTLMLDIHYLTHDPLPLDNAELYRLLRATTPTERKAIRQILNEFWVETSDGWINKRAGFEIEHYNARCEINRRNRATNRPTNGSTNRPTNRETNGQTNPESKPSDEPSDEPSESLRARAYTSDVKKKSARVNGADHSFDFDLFKDAYPKRSGSNPWPKAAKLAARLVYNGCDFEDLIDGARRYKRFCDATGKTGTELVMQAQRFLGPGLEFMNEWEIPDARSQNERTRDAMLQSIEEEEATA